MILVDTTSYHPPKCLMWEAAPRIKPCRWALWYGHWSMEPRVVQTVEIKRSEDALLLEQRFTLPSWMALRQATDTDYENY